MGEKRFKWDRSLSKIYDCDSFDSESYTVESYMDYEIADLLNQLNDENKELKRELEKLCEWYKLKDKSIDKKSWWK